MRNRPQLRYRVDLDDRIVFVSGEWDDFARANHGESILSDRVLGRTWMEFVEGASTRHLYSGWIQRVRSGGTVRFPFRCDSADRRRYMAMEMTPYADGLVEFMTTVVKEEERPAQDLLEPGRFRAGRFLQLCGWCKRVYAGGLWLEVELAVERLSIFERDPLPHLTHGICPTCSETWLREVDGPGMSVPA